MHEARFSPIAPIDMQRQLGSYFGNYHLLLAHEVLEHKEAYQTHYGPKGPGHNSFVIMDNSIIELGYPLKPKELIEAALAVEARCIVLPDVLGNSRGTVLKAQQSAESVKLPDEDTSWMGVIQGKDIKEAEWCAEQLLSINGLEYLSVPKIIADKNREQSRLPYLDMLQRMGVKDRSVHLLGFSNYLYDDMQCMAHPLVMGIDSATPVWYGMNRGLLPEELQEGVRYEFGKRPGNFWVMLGDLSQQYCVNTNIMRINGWIREAKKRGN